MGMGMGIGIGTEMKGVMDNDEVMTRQRDTRGMGGDRCMVYGGTI